MSPTPAHKQCRGLYESRQISVTVAIATIFADNGSPLCRIVKQGSLQLFIADTRQDPQGQKVLSGTDP